MIDWFSCAVQKKILAHGWMYVTGKYLCFHCNLLVYQCTEVIPIAAIVSIHKRHHMKINPGFEIKFRDAEGEVQKVEIYSFLDVNKVLSLLHAYP